VNDADASDLFLDEPLDDAAILSHLDDLGSVDQRHWPQRLVELIDVVAECLVRKHSLDKAVAHGQARDIAIVIGRYFGGQQVYIPFGKELERAVRDKAIWNDYTGENIDALVPKYRLTKVMLYNIIRAQRRLHVDRIQRNLF
jgi:Mor family transcriptional regulator